ncbi:unnamed protein product [Ectocarpus sp. 12 AP-2014]
MKTFYFRRAVAKMVNVVTDLWKGICGGRDDGV